MKILGIRRGLKFSPNLAGNDAAIFTTVMDELTAMGHEVSTIREEEMVGYDYTPYDRVVTMARNMSSIVRVMDALQDKEGMQEKFFNSLKGALVCMSKSLVALQMVMSEIPQPAFRIGQQKKIIFKTTNQEGDDGISYPLWLKNSDGSTTMSVDTLYCQTKKEYGEARKEFEQMGVDTWLVQEHKVGDLIKFYGVEGTGFFQWRYASKGHSKFGLEKINGTEKGYAFDAQQVQQYAEKLARALNVPIYGGDAVIDEEGNIWFIDFNDFPSFSSCREKGAKAIAKRIVKE